MRKRWWIYRTNFTSKRSQSRAKALPDKYLKYKRRILHKTNPKMKKRNSKAYLASQMKSQLIASLHLNKSLKKLGRKLKKRKKLGGKWWMLLRSVKRKLSKRRSNYNNFKLSWVKKNRTDSVTRHCWCRRITRSGCWRPNSVIKRS